MNYSSYHQSPLSSTPVTGDYASVAKLFAQYHVVPTSRPEDTAKSKIEQWFIDPLKRMGNHEGFVFIMTALPILELIMRLETKTQDELDVTLSDGSPALKWFASFLEIPERESRAIWDSLRNGLLHRAMIKPQSFLILCGRVPSSEKGRPAKYENGVTTIYVWDFRDKLVIHVEKKWRELWEMYGKRLPGIWSHSA